MIFFLLFAPTLWGPQSSWNRRKSACLYLVSHTHVSISTEGNMAPKRFCFLPPFSSTEVRSQRWFSLWEEISITIVLRGLQPVSIFLSPMKGSRWTRAERGQRGKEAQHQQNQSHRFPLHQAVFLCSETLLSDANKWPGVLFLGFPSASTFYPNSSFSDVTNCDKRETLNNLSVFIHKSNTNIGCQYWPKFSYRCIIKVNIWPVFSHFFLCDLVFFCLFLIAKGSDALYEAKRRRYCFWLRSSFTCA